MEEFDVIAYTDGACKGNPGVGGWGVFLQVGQWTHELYGASKTTTNNQMELTAAVKALAACHNGAKNILVFTDSKYLLQGITSWIKAWKANGWISSTKQPVKNKELWQQLDKLCKEHTVTWKLVKGHSGNPGNERADALANKGIQELKRQQYER